jgi:elongation factor G
MGANYRTAMNSIKSKLNLTIAPVQIPMVFRLIYIKGTDSGFKGLICLIKMKAYYFEGKSGEKIIEDNIPSEY